MPSITSSNTPTIDDWTLGAIFGVSWLIFYVPIALFGMAWFWVRRDKQPIKARSPLLVLISDVILIMYVMLLCIQRIAVDQYPCLINLWSGYVGTIVLFNTYLWRCWTLYFTFHLTQQKLSNNSNSEELPFFLRNRHYQSSRFVFKVLGTATCLLLIPCGILTATRPEISNFSGDGCNKAWGDALLAAYVAIYVAIFFGFAFKMRGIADGFKIKTELKWTGVIGIIAVIPWLVFNIAPGAKDINTRYFPVSTFFLVMAVGAAYALSTLWPLYRSIFQPPVIEQVDIPKNLNTLQGILTVPEGLASFQQFLTKEFSVENLLFYLEIEDYRTLKRDADINNNPESQSKVVPEAKRIHGKYIVIDAPFQVNLPDNIASRLEMDLKAEIARAKRASLIRLQQQQQAVAAAGGGTAPSADELLKLRREAANSISLNSKTDIHAKKEAENQYHSMKGKVKRARIAGMGADPSSMLIEEEEEEDVPYHPTIFDAAQRNIFHLMETDSYPRYMRSEIYKEFLASIRGQQHKQNVMRELDII